MKDKLHSTDTNDMGSIPNLGADARQQIRTNVEGVFNEWFTNHGASPLTTSAIDGVEKIAREYGVENFTLENVYNLCALVATWVFYN